MRGNRTEITAVVLGARPGMMHCRDRGPGKEHAFELSSAARVPLTTSLRKLRIYPIDTLPGAWRTFSLFNPMIYLISGFRWSFYWTAARSSELKRDDTAGHDVCDGFPDRCVADLLAFLGKHGNPEAA